MKASVLICAEREPTPAPGGSSAFCIGRGFSPDQLHSETMGAGTVRIRLEVECDEWRLRRLLMHWEKIIGVQSVVADPGGWDRGDRAGRRPGPGGEMRVDRTVERLAELEGSADCVRYCREAPLGGQKGKWISIQANCSTGETFVEVTDDWTTRVRSFMSRHKNCPPEARRQDMPLVDVADAFALARRMCQRWPRRWI